MIKKSFSKARTSNKFHAAKKTSHVRKSNIKSPERRTDKTFEKEIVKRRTFKTFDDMKQELEAWKTNERIPGKFQAWFTKKATPENSDWKITNKIIRDSEKLVIDAPARDMEIPETVQKVFDQLQKDHLRIFRKALQQIIFRATGDGRFALLIQANLRGKLSAHAHKTLVEFVERSLPAIISCHEIQCTPNRLFDPFHTESMRVDIKTDFGRELMPIASTGFCMHVLDWAPRIKDAWVELPERIKDAIHPSRGDRFFEFFSGCSFVGASLAADFEQVESLDCRESAMQSTKFNARNLAHGILHFHRAHLDVSTFTKFFSKSANDGRWTFYFNLPESESLSPEIVETVSASRPERILLQVSDLETAGKMIKRFRNEGYMLRKSIPLLLEEGSGRFELLMLFVPDRAGLLGQAARIHAQKGSIQKPKERVSTEFQGDIPHFVQKSPSFKQGKG